MTKDEEFIKPIFHAELLKKIARSGWSLAGINSIRHESVAEHSYGVIVISMQVAQKMDESGIDCDICKTMMMAAIHDLPESMISDIPHTSLISENASFLKSKQSIEEKAIHRIFKGLGEGYGQYCDLWSEYSCGNTLESKIVKGSDIIDMLMHALSLEDMGVSPELLNDFFLSGQRVVADLRIEAIGEIIDNLVNRHSENAKRAGVKLEIQD